MNVDKAVIADEQTETFDDIGGDVQSALNELRGGEAQPETPITLDKSERPRDEAGRFAQALKDDKAAKAEENAKPKRETLTLPGKVAEGVQADPAAQLGVAAVDAAPVVAAPTVAAITPPGAIKGELKAKFGELPPEWQQEFARCEAEAQKALRNQDEDRIFGRRINQMAAPYLATITAEGSTPEKAFGAYLNAAHVLRQGSPFQKAQALHQIAQQFNVDLNLPLQGAGSEPQTAHLEQRLAAAEARLQAQDEQRQQQEDQSLQSQIGAFASKPGHEHFDTVRTQMGALMEAGVTTDLEDAYQRAIWADPTIRSSLVEAQSKAAEEKRIAEQKALSDRARSAAVSVTGAPGSSRPLNGAQSHGSIEDDVRAAYAEAKGRV